MKIQKILSQSRRDFTAIYECEHCGATKKSTGYDSFHFHNYVIPLMKCEVCGEVAKDYRPLTPKHAESVQNMSKQIKWVGNHIEIDPPKKTKKITGTRFATILGLNPWSTDFEMWCAITKTFELPFEDTIYTLAGKAIEPKQAEYMEKAYVMDLTSPTDIWGEDYFKKTWGEFFPESHHFGGMWDFLLKNNEGQIEAVLEMKTTKRSEDWKNDIPEYYALQAALYAYLLGTDNVIMVASFLEDKDYDKPQNFVPTIENTIAREFKVSERYPEFDKKVRLALEWWNKYVATGISPDFDENKDAKILNELRKNNLNPTTEIEELIKEYEMLKAEIDKVNATISDKEKRIEKIKEMIKTHAQSQFRDGDEKVEIKGGTYTFTLAKTESIKIDEEKLKADGLLDKYSKASTSYRLNVK